MLRPLRELGEPIVDLSEAMPYTDAQTLLDEDYPDGGRYYWKSLELEALAPDGRATGSSSTRPPRPSAHSTVDIWWHGGAMGRVPADATAFGERAPILLGYEANFEDPADAAENVAWVRDSLAELEPFSDRRRLPQLPRLLRGGRRPAARLLRRGELRAARAVRTPGSRQRLPPQREHPAERLTPAVSARRYAASAPRSGAAAASGGAGAAAASGRAGAAAWWWSPCPFTLRATSTARLSRITVTLTCPGYSSWSSISRAISWLSRIGAVVVDLRRLHHDADLAARPEARRPSRRPSSPRPAPRATRAASRSSRALSPRAPGREAEIASAAISSTASTVCGCTS